MFWYFLVTYAVILEFVGLAAYTFWIMKNASKWSVRMTTDMLKDLDDKDELTETSNPFNN